MSISVVLAQPTAPTPEGTVTGRMSSSLVNDIDKAGNVLRFEEGGNAATGFVGGRWYNDADVPRTVYSVEVSAGTAPTGAGLVVDVKKNGTTVFAQAADRATVAATNFRSPVTKATKTGDPVIVRPGEYLQAEVTQVGSTVAGADISVKVKLI